MRYLTRWYLRDPEGLVDGQPSGAGNYSNGGESGASGALYKLCRDFQKEISEGHTLHFIVEMFLDPRPLPIQDCDTLTKPATKGPMSDLIDQTLNSWIENQFKRQRILNIPVSS